MTLRNRLVALFVVLVIVVGAGTLYEIERTLADDLSHELDVRLHDEGSAIARWLAADSDVARLAPHLAEVTGTHVTILAPDGSVVADSGGAALRQYVVAVPAEQGRTIRLAVPLGDVARTRARMRDRLLVGFGFGFLGALLLSWIFVRAITRPIQSLTRTAEVLAAGNYDAPAPAAAAQAGGELGVLARAMTHMAGEVKSRVGELTDQRDLLSVVVGGLVEGVVVVDAEGTIVLANGASRPLLDPEGRASGPISAGTPGTPGTGERLPAALAALVEGAQRGEQPEQELELNGRTVRASARPLRTPGPRPSAIVVLYDITRMRALEAVRRDFLSNAAHELRTPVTSISGYAETLLSGKVDSETSREFITTIHRNAKRIADMVSDLLVLDQLGGRATVVGERGSVVVAEVVGDAVRTAKGIAPAARIDVDVPPSLAVLATREGLDHVVQNLVDNAVKYGAETAVKVSATRTGSRARIAVEDAGPGIPAGQEERIFERFFRVDAGRSRDQGGSGLGLAIVKSHVEAMGGRVWYEDAKPGARFVVELDAAGAGES